MSNDWADEKAAAIRVMLGDLFVRNTALPSIAAALRAAERRGRVAGLREAAEIVRTGKSAFAIDDVRLLRSRADELETQA